MGAKKRVLFSRQLLSLAVAFCLLLTGVMPACGAPAALQPNTTTVQAALDRTVDYLATVQPENASPWVTIALRAAGYSPTTPGTVTELPNGAPTTDAAVQLLQCAADGGKGAAINALAADIAGVQLSSGKFADTLDGCGEELVNAHVWSVLALRSANRDIPRPQAALQWLLARQQPDGGFAFAAGLDSDVDMTAMALAAAVALGVERGQPAVERAMAYLDQAQAENGGFVSWGVECSESAATVLYALTALGENPLTGRWDNSGGNVVQALLRFQLSDGSFAHAAGGDSDLMATCQAALALSDYVAGQPFWTRLAGDGLFADVPSGHWAAVSITKLAGNGVFAGLPDGRFHPEGAITRAELAAILSRALALTPAPTQHFQDVPEDHWAAGSIAAVAQAGYLRGRAGGCFAPAAPVTGGELAAILCRVAELNIPAAAPGQPWWTPAVATADRHQLLGRETRPNEAATRAQVAWGVDYALTLQADAR